jgi:hypothetical protein
MSFAAAPSTICRACRACRARRHAHDPPCRDPGHARDRRRDRPHRACNAARIRCCTTRLAQSSLAQVEIDGVVNHAAAEDSEAGTITFCT